MKKCNYAWWNITSYQVITQPTFCHVFTVMPSCFLSEIKGYRSLIGFCTINHYCIVSFIEHYFINVHIFLPFNQNEKIKFKFVLELIFLLLTIWHTCILVIDKTWLYEYYDYNNLVCIVFIYVLLAHKMSLNNYE